MRLWRWPLTPLGTTDRALPLCIVTRRPFDAGGALDPAKALVLPSGDDLAPSQMVRHFRRDPAHRDLCLGLWLARHTLPGKDLLADLRQSDLGWVGNFPGSTMFGAAFGRQLAEVGTGRAEECAALAAFKTAGKRIMLTVTPGPGPLDRVAADAILLVIRSAEDLKALTEGFLDRLRAAYGAHVPIVVHGGRDDHLPRAPREMGVAAIMRLPSTTHAFSSGYTASSD